MNKKTVYLMFVTIALISCSKTESTSNGDTGVTTVHVFAFKSKEPVAGASVEVGQYRMDASCSCFNYNSIKVLHTDASGNCDVENKYLKSADYLILIGGENIWQINTQNTASKPTEYPVEFKDHLRIHLVRGTNYPDDAVIGFACSGEGGGFTVPNGYSSFSGADSLFTIDAFGAEKNTIRWTVIKMNVASVDSTLGSGSVTVDVKHGSATDLEIKY